MSAKIQTDSQEQNDVFSSFGFTKIARRNLIVAIIAIQFSAITYLFKDNSQLNKQIIQIKTAQADSSNAQYARLVAKVEAKLLPVQQMASNLVQNSNTVDSLQRKLKQN